MNSRALCFFLVLSTACTAWAQKPDASAEALRMEMVFWESVRSSTDPADFRAYLEQYPNGKFAPLARNRLAALSPAAPAAPAPATATAPSNVPAAPAATGPGGVAVGDSWTYRLSEPRRVDGPKQREYTVKVASVANHAIVEQYAITTEKSGEWSHSSGGYIAGLGRSLFAPYLVVFPSTPSSGPIHAVRILDPACNGAYVCTASARVVGRETVNVPAGTFQAIKVHVEHNWQPAAMSGIGGGDLMGSRTLTVWYAPEVKRAVKFASRPNIGRYPPVETHFDLELTSYKVAGPQ